MAELIAQGPKPEHRWRRLLPAGEAVSLGRSPESWAVPWERFLSRRHARLTWHAGHLEVERCPEAHNPVFHQGKPESTLRLAPGDYFVIGNTTFTVLEPPAEAPADDSKPLKEETFSAHELNQAGFQDAPGRLDVLNRLPEVIAGAGDDAELSLRLVQMLLAGIPRAEAVALVVLDPAAPTGAPVRVLHGERRNLAAGGFQPSRRLVRRAVQQEQGPVLHVWATENDSSFDKNQGRSPFDWAFCVPVGTPATNGWAIYVTGYFGEAGPTLTYDEWQEKGLRDDLKFTVIAAGILNALHELRALQRRQTSLGQFFSPPVLRTITGGDPDEVLQPRRAEVAVLFCDLRGFSRLSARAADLLALLDRVSQALGVMTQNILDQGGVIGDFQGDAAMGFWGWPLAAADRVERACRAALGIRAAFAAAARDPRHPLADFQVGVGIAAGSAVAGRIGTADQVKVTVFGPVVNLASRLEGMTKIFKAPILLDEAAAVVAREKLPPGLARCRRVARVQPFGLETPLTVTELLPPLANYPEMTDAHLADYETAVDALEAGDWGRAYDLLRRMPTPDGVPDFLTELILRHGRRPPTGWQGWVVLDTK